MIASTRFPASPSGNVPLSDNPAEHFRATPYSPGAWRLFSVGSL